MYRRCLIKTTSVLVYFGCVCGWPGRHTPPNESRTPAIFPAHLQLVQKKHITGKIDLKEKRNKGTLVDKTSF